MNVIWGLKDFEKYQMNQRNIIHGKSYVHICQGFRIGDLPPWHLDERLSFHNVLFGRNWCSQIQPVRVEQLASALGLVQSPVS